MPDDKAGEVPKAYVVKSASVGLEENDRMLARSIQKHVEEHKARHKWLKGGMSICDRNMFPGVGLLIRSNDRGRVHRCDSKVAQRQDTEKNVAR